MNTPTQNPDPNIDTDDFVHLSIIHDPEAGPVTEVVRYDQFVMGLIKPGTEQVMALHGALGVCGESGELGDAIKKEYIYGKPRDLDNIIEELGDLEFYVQYIRKHYGVSRQQVLQANADKLAKRYVNLKYSDAAAIARADKTPPTA